MRVSPIRTSWLIFTTSRSGPVVHHLRSSKGSGPGLRSRDLSRLLRVWPVEPSTQHQSAQPPQNPPLSSQPHSQCQVETSSQSFCIFRSSLSTRDLCSISQKQLQPSVQKQHLMPPHQGVSCGEIQYGINNNIK